jgi:hypothetical protein
MTNSNGVPDLVKSILLDGILRIDVALEGDWSPTVVTVWSRETGFAGFSKVTQSHRTCKPSLELYFQGVWLGIHCFRRINAENVFNEDFARNIIDYVEGKLFGKCEET